jgi:hypothetical protein
MKLRQPGIASVPVSKSRRTSFRRPGTVVIRLIWPKMFAALFQSYRLSGTVTRSYPTSAMPDWSAKSGAYALDQ